MAALAPVGLAASMPRQTARLNNIRFNSLHPLVFRPQLRPLTGEFRPDQVQAGQESVKIGSELGPQARHFRSNRQAIKSGIDHLTAMCLTPVRAAGKRAIPLRSRDPVTKQEEARERVLDLMEALPVGQTIPSERQLTQELGVSRLTIRAALDGLVRVKRLRLADDQPMAMEVLHIPEALVPGLTKSDLEDHSFYELLEEIRN